MKSREATTASLKAASAAIDQGVGMVCALLMGAMTVVVIVGVFFRYVLNAPLNWVEETSRYLMIWGASLAISLGVSAGEHVGLTVILDSLKKPAARKAMTLLINGIVLLFLVFMAYYAVFSTLESSSQMTQALGISMFIPKLAVPLAMMVAAIQVILMSALVLNSADGRGNHGAGYIDI